jgi:two-component system NtrC family sensor kinase
MPNANFSIINIGLVGGGKLCEEILKKTTFDLSQEDVSAPILAVADPNSEAPGIVLAKKLGLLTFDDYRALYDRRYSIHLIVILSPEDHILEDVIENRPPRIRVMSYPVFNVFWRAIGAEERKLRERTEEITTILNGIQDFILVITPDSVIVDVNEAFLERMGYTRDEVIGHKCYEVYQRANEPCKRPETACPLTSAIRNRRPSHQIRPRLGPDGKTRYFDVSVFPIWEKDGKISKFIEISRDVTERIKEEEEITGRLEEMVGDRTRQLKESHDKLLHQDKMSSLGKLSASVVHEINNPIAGILNLTMLVKRIIREESVNGERMSSKDSKQVQKYLDLMEMETRRIGRIVSNLLTFSREEKMEFKQLDLNRLIEKTLFLSANLLKISGVKVDRKMAPDLPRIFGSEDQLQQVFMNMVSNAAETMETAGGGVLTIETKHASRKDRVEIRFGDTGIGIPKESFSKLFEPFYTTKKRGKGVGLGLSVAYGIIKDHGGFIYVDSKRGEGATFKIELPLKQPSEAVEGHGGSDDRH